MEDREKRGSELNMYSPLKKAVAAHTELMAIPFQG